MALLDSIDSTDTCTNCRWWDDDRDGTGSCRYNTPTVIAFGDQVVTAWPQTGNADWCGSHTRA